MSLDLFIARSVISQKMVELEALFVPEMKLSFIARLPGNEECELVISADTLPEIRRVLERMEEREKPKEVQAESNRE